MHRTLLTAALILSASLLPACRITDKGVDVSMVRDRVMPTEQDQVYVESGSNAGGPDTAPAAAAPTGTTHSYTVQPGDTLSKIAARHQVPLADLYRANNLTGTSIIRVGQHLTIPSSNQPSPTTPAATPAAPLAPASHGSTYTVQAGDTLSSIARRHGLSMQAILQANHLSMEQAGHLRIGQTLRLPPHP